MQIKNMILSGIRSIEILLCLSSETLKNASMIEILGITDDRGQPTNRPINQNIDKPCIF